MKKLILILLLLPATCFPQDWKQHYEVPTKNSRFNVSLPVNTRVAPNDTNMIFRLTRQVGATDSMATVYRNGWYVALGGSGGSMIYDSIPFYTYNGGTTQRFPNDSLMLNYKVKQPDGLILKARQHPSPIMQGFI
jgi:hypothetical protein